MELFLQISKLTAGIGLFLFAMYLIEEALKNFSGRNFKRFLQRATKNKVGAAAGGAIVTGILQSSSMVSLMVLAFVGAGVFTMKNALAIILGANLGTTLDSWLIAGVGFNLNIELIAYPAVCIGGLLMILQGNRKMMKYTAFFLFGFGLLFIGLSFMKTAMESKAGLFNFAAYADMPAIVFLLMGFVITVVIQSSSATTALTLSALHAGAIGFLPAAAIVLGAETGTTIKIMISGIGGNANKKRVVTGNFIFTFLLTCITYLFLQPILHFILHILQIANPLIALVTFSSLINLAGVVLFLPFIDPFANLLEKWFRDTDGETVAFIRQANISEPETALDLFRRETAYFIHNAMIYNAGQFELNTDFLETNDELRTLNLKRKFGKLIPEEKYELLRRCEGEMITFYLKMRNNLQSKDNIQLNQLITSVRSCMYAVKCIKDVSHNISNLNRSSKDVKYNFFVLQRNKTSVLYLRLHTLLQHAEKDPYESLHDIYHDIEHTYSKALNDFYKEAQNARLEDNDIATVLNLNRELFTSNKAMLMAVKDFMLDEKKAEEFNDIPVYRA